MTSGRYWPYWLIGLFALASAAVYIWKPGSNFTLDILTNLIAAGAAAIAFGAALSASRLPNAQPRAGWRFLAIGLGLFFLGESTWGVQEAVLRIKNPFPSVADAAWLAGYFFLGLGLILTWRYLDISLNSRETVIVFAAGAAVFAGAAYVLLLPIARSGQIGFIEKALDIAYPLADLIIIVPAVALMLTFDNTLCGRSWRLICAGFILIAVGDLGFSYLSWTELYWADVDQPGNFIDLFWVAGYLTIAVGILYYDQVMRDTRGYVRSRRRRPGQGRAA